MDHVKEPIVPNITPSQDDIDIRQRQMKSRRPTSVPASTTRNSGSGSALGIIGLTVAVVALAGAGYLFTQLQSLQAELQSERQLMEQQSRTLATLNDRLSATGENASLSLDALKVLLKEHDSEIRKLWDVANKRNKQNIAENASALTEQRKSIVALGNADKAFGTELEAQKGVAVAQQQQLEQQQQNLGELENRVVSTEATLLTFQESELRIAQNSETLQGNSTSISKLRTQLAERDKELERLTKRLQMLEERVTTLHTPAATR